MRTADASGKIDDTTLTLSEKFTTGSGDTVDCAAVKCVIGISPLPTSNPADVVAANTVDMPLTFGAAAVAPAPEAAPARAAPEAAPGRACSECALPKSGPGDSLPVILIAGITMLSIGAGVLLLMPSRRRIAGRA